MCKRRQRHHLCQVDVMELFLTRHACKQILSQTRARWNQSCRNTLCWLRRVNIRKTNSDKNKHTMNWSDEHVLLKWKDRHSLLTWNRTRELETAFVLCVLVHAGNVKFRFQHGPFTKRFGPVVTRVPAVVLSISRFSWLAVARAWIFALNKLTTQGTGT